MSLTTDPNDPNLRVVKPDGQQKTYLVLSGPERAKGFVRPLRTSYKHLACGGVTWMARPLAETYAREPHFYSGTFCANCGTHFRLRDGSSGVWNFLWEPDGDPVGSDVEEATEWKEAKAKEEVEKQKGSGI